MEMNLQLLKDGLLAFDGPLRKGRREDAPHACMVLELSRQQGGYPYSTGEVSAPSSYASFTEGRPVPLTGCRLKSAVLGFSPRPLRGS